MSLKKYFRDKNYFEEDGNQNYLVFRPMQSYFKRISGVGSGNYIYFWKSRGFLGKELILLLHLIILLLRN